MEIISMNYMGKLYTDGLLPTNLVRLNRTTSRAGYDVDIPERSHTVNKSNTIILHFFKYPKDPRLIFQEFSLGLED